MSWLRYQCRSWIRYHASFYSGSKALRSWLRHKCQISLRLSSTGSGSATMPDPSLAGMHAGSGSATMLDHSMAETRRIRLRYHARSHSDRNACRPWWRHHSKSQVGEPRARAAVPVQIASEFNHSLVSFVVLYSGVHIAKLLSTGWQPD